MNQRRALSGLFTGALVALALTAAGVAIAAPVGNLEIQGNVRLASAASDVYFRMSDTRHAWFSGDRIDTGGGTAILDLDGGIYIGFPRETRAALSIEGGVIRVDLEAGAMLYAIPQSRMELVITSGQEMLSTRPDSDYRRVAAPGPGSFGIVQRLDDGQLRVTVRDGLMTVGDRQGNALYRVEANQRVRFTGEGPGLMIAQIEAIAPPPEPEPEVVAEPAPPAPPAPVAGGVNPLVLGGIALAGLGIAAAGGGGGGGGPRPEPPPPSP